MGIFTGQIDINAIQSYINTDVLPKIGQGLVMTKDYLYQLGGRYIYYNITLNSIGLIAGIVLLIIAYKLFKLLKDKEEVEEEGGDIGYVILLVGSSMIGCFLLVTTVMGLLGWMFVPEIQIYKSFTGTNN